MTEENIIQEREKKLLKLFKKEYGLVIVFLIIALILGVYIRTQPIQDNNGKPGLWDISTNTWTLGPDLDPWLFERYAKEFVQGGSIPRIDVMRNVPLGFDTTEELQMVSYFIVATYKIINLFGDYSIEFAAVINPVIMFAFTILAFFFMTREIFIKKDSANKNLSANIIAGYLLS